MPAVNLSPLFNDAQLDSAGNPGVGLKLFTYAAGSSTKVPVYTTSIGDVAHSNAIILNSRGEPPSPIWIADGVSIKFVLAPSTDTDPPSSPIRTVDNVMGTNDVNTVVSEWTSGPAPTFVSSTSFTLAGDQTTNFHIGRRLKSIDSGGTDYTTISGSTFAASLTTVKVDAAVLDAGLSAVAYGPSANNTAIPLSDVAIISPYAPLAPFENLVVATTSGAAATITADRFVVHNSAGRKVVLAPVSLTVNIGTAGANGLDTGAEAASTWYYLHVILNGATKAGLFSLSAIAPTLPSGYTHWGLAGAVRNNASSDFNDTSQNGNLVSVVSLPALTDGSSTAVSGITLSAFVPPAARAVMLRALVTALSATPTSGSVFLDAGGTILGMTAGNVSTSATSNLLEMARVLLRSPQSLWYSVANVNTDLTLNVIGWEW